MKIEVRLYANLRAYRPSMGSVSFLDVPENCIIRQLLEILMIPDDVEKIVLLNGRQAREDSRLREGDKVVLFPPATGG